MTGYSTTGAQVWLGAFRFDVQLARRVLQVSFPLMGSTVGNLVMVLVDRVCLARYSSETLAASGPATYTAETFILVFVATVSFSRSCVAQAFGRGGLAAAAQQSALGILVGVVCAALLFVAAPLIELTPYLSGRPAAIKLLESQYLFWAAQFGSVMTLNTALSAYFSGTGRTRIALIAGLSGQGVTIFMTIGLVFGKYSLPELGMRGSALGTLAGTLVILVVYLLYMPREVWRALGQLLRQRQHATWTALGSRLRQGFPLGTYAGADMLGNTAFVWIIGSLGALALAANNINLTLNFVAVIPLMGLGVGCSVLCGNAIGANEYGRIYQIIFVTLCIEMLYIVPVSFMEITTPGLLLDLFGLQDKSAEIRHAAAATSQVLWVYSVAYALTMTGSAVLQSFGLTRFPFITRVTIMWGLSIPVVYFMTSSHLGNADFLPGCWIIAALFEGLIGAMYFWRIRTAVKRRQNKIVLHADDAIVRSQETT